MPSSGTTIRCSGGFCRRTRWRWTRAFNFNRYAYANNSPYKFKDLDGRAAETVWDAINVGLGVSSFIDNARAGNWGAATVDAVGVVVDSAATVVPFVPGGASAAIKTARTFDRAAQMLKNAEQGAKAEKAVVKELGDKVAGRRVTLESSTGQRSVVDIVKTDKSVVEVKSGGAQLSPGQKAIKADIDAGRLVTPRGQNAKMAGLEPGRPTQMKCFEEKRC